MTFPSFKSRLLASLWMGALGAAALGTTIAPARAQVSLSTTPTTQNFDSIGTAATATLPSGFKVDKNTSIGSVGTYAAATTATEQVDGASVGSSATNGIYNFGSGATDTGTDRAVGFLSSGSATKSGNLYVQLRNDTGAPVTQLPLSYSIEKYRNGSNAAGFRIQLFYSTDGGATFTSAGSGFLTSFSADADSNGATPAPLNSTAVAGTLTLPAPLSPAASVILAWNYSVSAGTVTSNAQALAIDDFTFSGSDGGAATPTPTPGGTPDATPTATATPGPSATPLPSAATAGALISEYRLGGPSGASDEFIELYNQTNSALDLTSWTVTAGVVTVTIPSGKVIPPYGHLLLTGSAYSLAGYGGTSAATGDVSYTGDIPFGATLTLRNGAGSAVDVVSSSGLPSPTSATSNYSYVRRMDGAGGAALDTDSDVNDFNLVDVASKVGPNNTTGVSSGLLRLGAPGPQNLASAIAANQLISFVPASPASVRTGSGNGGTLALRYVLTNRAGSGKTITALRFRVVALTAGTTVIASDGTNSNGPADVRLISSSASGSILPLTLQTPPAQTNGGGLNASVSLSALPGGGLTQGQAVTVELLFNVVQRGQYRFLLNAEPVTADGSGSTLSDDDNMLLGNPSAAIDVASSTDKENLLVRHPAESIGYQKSIGGPRWVSWHLTQSDIGTADRGDFHTDALLPSDCRITSSDYTGSGFDRGHMCPSGDRTASDALNDDTFNMSNILPQTAALNQQVWATLENYCRDQVKAGQECYIMSGGIGSSGTIAGGKVNVPASCWKVVVILPKGTSDISRITKSTRVIAVIMPNTTTITGNYSNYYSTVDAIESATGLDLLSNLPDDIENYLEASTTNR